MLADVVEVRRTIVETEMRMGRDISYCEIKSSDLPSAATIPERVCSKWEPKACPREPIVFGGRCTLFRRALSVGVTLLDAACINPYPIQGRLLRKIAHSLDLVEAFAISLTIVNLPHQP